MSLIDVTYFDTVFLNIPDGGDYGNREEYINHYEPKIINQLFGYELGKDVLAYTASSDQRIKDIVEGKEYTNSSDKLTKWEGLVNANKESLISYYVYYWWMRKTATTTTNNGEVKVLNENSGNTTPALKVMNAWNNMMQQCETLYEFMTEFEDDYPEWDFTPFSGSVNAFDL